MVHTSSASFRDSVLLLRHLTADLRTESQILQMSSAMNLLIHEQETAYSHDGGILESDDQPTDKTPSRESEAQNSLRPPVRQRLDAHRAFREVLALTKFDFTRDVILIIELAGFFGADKFEYIPLRNKIDTGSSENFIRSDILTEHKMDEEKILDLPVSEQTERTLQMVEGTFTPKREVYLRWHRPHDGGSEDQRIGEYVDRGGFKLCSVETLKVEDGMRNDKGAALVDMTFADLIRSFSDAGFEPESDTVFDILEPFG
ncbi:hypothetical protein SAPIO_CDS1287 [Scedosporium apiospermum]|uniref:Uncharacterized protein n=1 Tax=Pseudallescheria apiosperma TaxID=563466 RepID=A0A084GEZ6_PSEDA|nr:uncharacterized protein SAPIO_CDS1287 [Scedosporium apiospermum]KEZ45908.1 hypothetical protein SAPIO_CDS1287 [Scedosporium apiospermum]